MAGRGRPKKVVEEVVEEVKVENKIEEIEVKKEVIKNTPKVSEVRTSPKFNMNDEVRVVSLVKRGKLIFEDHEGTIYEWGTYNSDNWITIKGLLHMRNRHRKFFTTPLVKVEEDVAQFLKIDVMYQDLIDVEDIDSLFNLSPNELEDVLVKIPKGIQNIVVDAARQKYRDKTLDSMQKIRIIQNICKTEIIEESDKIIIMNNK